ncbi:MAG TPA: ferrichrome ABC transporter permease, partial [Vicinamibacteria bacterium]|nr:ferrichrome ABC transporter permease [Vicinamibacteria bacterium]
MSSHPAPHSYRDRYLFAAAIGLGAFLLFQVQFIMGKEILPWFGGAPAVWTTCMLFFQVGLLLGYLYAHVLSETLPLRSQRMVQLLVLGLTLGLLVWRGLTWPSPLTPGDAWKPRPSEAPVAKILTLLSFSVGLPYLVLSATGPLLQSWFSRAWPGRSPYRLYALSNLGSLLGLLSYPFLLEPVFPLGAQGWLWGVGFAVFAAGCGATALFVGRLPPASRPPGTSPTSREETAPAVSRRILWFFLAAVASIMLLAVTNQICQEVAVIPFLWVLPLILYLLSFILCFEYEGFYRRWFWVMLLALAAGAAVTALTKGTSLKIPQQIGIYSFVLWAYCMACHGELVSLKPAARHLTSFYLTVAAGGAAGGILTGLVAPRIFPAFWELHCALFAGPVLVAVVLLLDRSSWLHHGPRWRAWTLRLVLPAALVTLGVSLERLAADSVRDSELVARNFFGVLRVIREDEGTDDETLRLRHGRITHGMQLTAPARRREPTTYYGPASGVGLILEHHSRRGAAQPLRVGVV